VAGLKVVHSEHPELVVEAKWQRQEREVNQYQVIQKLEWEEVE
jgi:hypothetical protein